MIMIVVALNLAQCDTAARASRAPKQSERWVRLHVPCGLLQAETFRVLREELGKWGVWTAA